MIDLSKAYDRINVSLLCDKLRATSLPTQIINLLEFMGQNTLVSTSYGGHLSDQWKVGNGVRQGGITSGILFNFYLNDVLTGIADLPVGCSLNGSKFNILCYADDIVLLAPTVEASQILLDTLACELGRLSLKINVDKSCNIVFKYNNRDIKANLTLQGLPLRPAHDCTYLGVVLQDDMACTKDAERAVKAFFRQYNSLYHKFSFVDTDVLIHLFKLHAMSFYGTETWFMKLYKKDIKKVAVPYHGAIKRICGRSWYDSNHECLEYAKLRIFKHLLAKKIICYAHKLFSSKSPCLSAHRYYFRHMSIFSREVKDSFHENYQLTDVHNNPLCAVLARIDFVQRTEPRSQGYDPG